MQLDKRKRSICPQEKTALTTDWNKMMQELFNYDFYGAHSTPESSSGVASDDHCYNTSDSSANASPYQTKEEQRIKSVVDDGRFADMTNHASSAVAAAAAAAAVARRAPLLTSNPDAISSVSPDRRLSRETGAAKQGLWQQQQQQQNRRQNNSSEDRFFGAAERSEDAVVLDARNHIDCRDKRLLARNNIIGTASYLPTAASAPPSGGGHGQPTTTTTTFPGSWRERSRNSSPRQSPSRSLFDAVPADVVLRVFSRLHSDDLCRCARVCRRWYRIVWNPVLWTTITINDPGADVDRALRCLTRILGHDTPAICVVVEGIDLRTCERLTDGGLCVVASRCPELRRMTLDGCVGVTNIAVFEVVSRCVNIEYLSVIGCSQITCISLTPEAHIQATAFGRHIDLTYLDMSDCANLDDFGLQVIVSYCSRLVYLYLRRCTKVTDIGIQYLATYCGRLMELSVNDCYRVTDFGMREMARLEGRLRYLSVAKCEAVTDAGLKAVVRACTRLRYLNVRGCRDVTDESLVYLATRCTRLRSLDLGRCRATDRTLFGLAEHSPQLRKLSLRGCEWVTDRGVVELARRCRQLMHVNLQDCCLVTIETFRALRHFCRDCVIEHTNPGFH